MSRQTSASMVPLIAGFLAAAVLAPMEAAAQQKVLKVVPMSEPKVLDMHQSAVNPTSMHVAMVYDTLFTVDADLIARPQMVGNYTVSADKLKYTFTLRPGLKFHDGTPVTSKDVIQTWKRQFVRDTQIGKLAEAVASYDKVDDNTFTLTLKEPFGFVEYLISGTKSIEDGIMREKEALTDPYTPVTTMIGSGPFTFNTAEYVMGAKLVYDKNRAYVPRNEPPSGQAGGKVVKVDRVEYVIIPDAATAYAALRKGEIDFIDAASLDLIKTVENDPNIVIGEVWPVETYGVLRPNSLHPPFNNVKARQALAHMVQQSDYLELAFGDKKWWHECYAFWVCGTPNGTEAGSEAYRKQNLDLARQLVKESGYDGKPVVIIGGADIPAYNAWSQLTASLLKQIGFNVDMQMTDWGVVAVRRAKKDPPAQGGWNLFHTNANGAHLASPLTSPSTIMTCDGKNFVGWPCDEVVEKMRDQYVRETDPAKQKVLVEQMHKRLWEVMPYVTLGQFRQPFLWRKNITGVLKTGTLVFWNIDKS
ncbi:MAG: ABC transporter substrate-binding protein [Proteobacteria bacterium]|nr:ABC transporter substrate-binding protein [Pseudomonadota bacterium]MBI3498141.1 ABC transporter substrate-binding protein [Pseudomonadota bacterium]